MRILHSVVWASFFTTIFYLINIVVSQVVRSSASSLSILLCTVTLVVETLPMLEDNSKMFSPFFAQGFFDLNGFGLCYVVLVDS